MRIRYLTLLFASATLAACNANRAGPGSPPQAPIDPTMSGAPQDQLAASTAAYHGHLELALELGERCQIMSKSQESSINKEWHASLNEVMRMAGQNLANRVRLVMISQEIVNKNKNMSCSPDGFLEFSDTLFVAELLGTENGVGETPESDVQLYKTYAIGTREDEVCHSLDPKIKNDMFKERLRLFGTVYKTSNQKNRELLLRTDNALASNPNESSCTDAMRARIDHARDILVRSSGRPVPN